MDLKNKVFQTTKKGVPRKFSVNAKNFPSENLKSLRICLWACIFAVGKYALSKLLFLIFLLKFF